MSDNMDNEKTANTAPADLNKIIMQRKFTCPVCNGNFENWDVASYKVRIVRSDTDLRNYFAPYDPMYYAVVICYWCGYSAQRSDFSQILPKQIKLIREKITPNFVPSTYPQIYDVDIAIERYKLALQCTDAKEGKISEKAMICLRLSWLYRDKDDEESEKTYREEALKGLLQAFETERFPIAGMDHATMDYLIGELYRRCGNLEEASKHIGKVIVLRGIASRLKERALDVKDLILQEKAVLENPVEENEDSKE
ncbi:MAG: DUF2225 domain-containing protein [Defluviitaleaceae bacterium]|nr:DUF2225 domain-containing protein [Defluviitaleaceae bacterium]